MIKIKAYAKINLFLDVIGKRNDGYHFLQTIMQTVDLADKIILKKAENISLVCSNSGIPIDKQNLAWKAAELFFKLTGIKKRVAIQIEKNIPIAGGLAGGSADAAAVLVGLNKLFKTGLSMERLATEAEKLGADVPYCIFGGTVLAEGIGEKLTLLKSLKDIWLVLVKPDFKVSTEWAYKNLELREEKREIDIEKILNFIENQDIKKLAQNMKNVLESVTLKKYPEVLRIKNQMLNCGALGSMMSGSGPSVFGLFKDKALANKAYKYMKRKYKEAYLTKMVEGRGNNGRI